MFVLVLFHFDESIFVPKSKPCACRIFSKRFWNKAGLNPSANRSSMDSQQSGCLRDRDFLVHQLMHHGGLYVKKKANPGRCARSCADPGHWTSIAECSWSGDGIFSEVYQFSDSAAADVLNWGRFPFPNDYCSRLLFSSRKDAPINSMRPLAIDHCLPARGFRARRTRSSGARFNILFFSPPKNHAKHVVRLSVHTSLATEGTG